ncbi:hypothetical protein [Methylomonas fluvii]|nr:hypothetical protein [Methylomonas fluvii]
MGRICRDDAVKQSAYQPSVQIMGLLGPLKTRHVRENGSTVIVRQFQAQVA